MVRAAVGREETRRSAAKRKELRAVMGEKKKRDEDVGLSIDRKMRGKRETLHFLFSSATTKKKKRPRSPRRQSSTPSPSLSLYENPRAMMMLSRGSSASTRSKTLARHQRVNRGPRRVVTRAAAPHSRREERSEGEGFSPDF